MEQKYKYNSYEQSNAPLMFHKSQSWDSTINAPSWPYILWDSSLSLHVKVTNTNWHLSIYREKHLSFSFYKAASQNSKILPPAPQQYTSQPLCWRAAFSCLKTNYFFSPADSYMNKEAGRETGEHCMKWRLCIGCLCLTCFSVGHTCVRAGFAASALQKQDLFSAVLAAWPCRLNLCQHTSVKMTLWWFKFDQSPSGLQ